MRTVLALLWVAILASCGWQGPGAPHPPADAPDGAPSDPGENPPSAADVARLVIAPSAITLFGHDDAYAVRATALDDQGASVPLPALRWIADDDGVVTVTPTADGATVTARAALGSTQIRAVAGAVESPRVGVSVVTAKRGAVPYDDAQVVGDPAVVAGTAAGLLGARLTAKMHGLRGVAPGAILVPRGEGSIAGRVVRATPSGNDVEVEVETVPLTEMFDDLELARSAEIGVVGPSGASTSTGASTGGAPGAREARPLAQGSDPTEAPKGYAGLGLDACEMPDGIGLDTLDFTLHYWPKGRVTLRVSIANGELRSMDVRGEGTWAPEASLVAQRIVAKVGVRCGGRLLTVAFPIYGPLWGLVPIDAHLEADGSVTVADANLTAFGRAGATGSFALSYASGAGVTTERHLQPIAEASFAFAAQPFDTGWRADLTGRLYVDAFVQAQLRVGPFRSDAWELLKLEAGVKQESHWAMPIAQARDPSMRAGSVLTAPLDIQVGSAIASLYRYFGVEDPPSINPFPPSDAPILAQTPRGKLVLDRATYAGDANAAGTVEYDPSTISPAGMFMPPALDASVYAQYVDPITHEQVFHRVATTRPPVGAFAPSVPWSAEDLHGIGEQPVTFFAFVGDSEIAEDSSVTVAWNECVGYGEPLCAPNRCCAGPGVYAGACRACPSLTCAGCRGIRNRFDPNLGPVVEPCTCENPGESCETAAGGMLACAAYGTGCRRIVDENSEPPLEPGDCPP